MSDTVSDIPAGRRGGPRHRRRHLGLPATVATVALTVVLAVGCGVRHYGAQATGAAKHNGIVPWTSRRAPVLKVRAAPVASPAALYSPCTAAHLSARTGMITPGAGQDFLTVTLANTGTSPCTLTGHPTVTTGTSASGGTVSFTTTYSGEGPGSPGPANLAPGGIADVGLQTAAECAANTPSQSLASVQLAVDGGEVTASLPSGQAFGTGCGVGVSDFGTPQQQAQPSSPFDALTIQISMPAQVRAGSVVKYLVTLANPTNRAISLRTCPSYREFLAVFGTNPFATTRLYYLNCQDARSIPAHQSVTFAMRIRAQSVHGLAKYGWSLQGTSIRGGGTVKVTS